MSELTLKSALFRKEREDKWQELEDLIYRVEKRGFKNLSADEIIRLQALYRVTLSSLSVARSISLDRSLLDYLEALSARAYFCVYGPQSTFLAALGRFFLVDFPASLRAIGRPIMLAGFILILATLAGYSLTISDPDWYYAFVSDGLANGRTPASTKEELEQGLFNPTENTERLKVFASYLFVHNTKIGILAFAFGFAFGIPTVLLLATNGLMLGAFSALYVSKGLGTEIHGWLFIHGTTEIFAIIICGGAGLALGGASIFPGHLTRRDSLIKEGKKTATVMMGAVLMFFAAGILEGFGRQLIIDTGHRYIIGGIALVLWLTYFFYAGRKQRHDG